MPVVILYIDRVVMVRVVAPIWVPTAVPSAVVRVHVAVIRVVPTPIPSAISVIPRVIPASDVERVVPAIVSVWGVCP